MNRPSPGLYLFFLQLTHHPQPTFLFLRTEHPAPNRINIHMPLAAYPVCAKPGPAPAAQSESRPGRRNFVVAELLFILAVMLILPYRVFSHNFNRAQGRIGPEKPALGLLLPEKHQHLFPDRFRAKSGIPAAKEQPFLHKFSHCRRQRQAVLAGAALPGRQGKSRPGFPFLRQRSVENPRKSLLSPQGQGAGPGRTGRWQGRPGPPIAGPVCGCQGQLCRSGNRQEVVPAGHLQLPAIFLSQPGQCKPVPPGKGGYTADPG